MCVVRLGWFDTSTTKGNPQQTTHNNDIIGMVDEEKAHAGALSLIN